MATTEQFSLRWNNFHSNLTTSFHELLEAAEMVDVTLAVDGHFLQAHKIVLSICSPYFKQMFKVNPCKHPIVILKDVCHENMKDILEFMYMGEVNVLRENLSSFLRTAELLQVKGLTENDSSETSSKKDEKLDGICENEDDSEIMQFNQLIDSHVEIPSHYSTPSRVPTPPPQPKLNNSGNTKRQAKPTASGTISKRSKSDAPVNNTSITTKQINSVDIKEQENGNENVMHKKYEDIDVFNACDLKTDNVKSEKNSMEFEDCKDGSKSTDSNNLGNSSATDTTVDSDLLVYSVDQKGHVFCPYCFRKFVNRYNLKVHVRDKHEDQKINLDCMICGKTMRNRSCLRVHMYNHRKQQLESETTVV